MSYIALYREWRPLVFEDIVEQQHIVKTLKYSVETGRIAHAYLFSGTRGTGKTTMAQIFSRAINCLNPKNGSPCNKCDICTGILSGSIMDILEIDAASNNSVDNIRNIRDEVIYMPSHAKYKVYIIDEVHMLSSGAFNALLKTLEEPPSHVVFILATTEPHKLPVTVLSRCQKFEFKRITIGGISEKIETIAKSCSVNVEKETARLIARMSDGALRDAISLLDQCISLGSKAVSYDDVLSIAGIAQDILVSDIVNAIHEKDINKILELVDKLILDGKDVGLFLSDLILYYRNVLICKSIDGPENIIEAPAETVKIMKEQSTGIDKTDIVYIIRELSMLESGLKWSTHPRIMLEVSLIKICEYHLKLPDDDVMGRLDILEKKINNLQHQPQPQQSIKNTYANFSSEKPISNINFKKSSSDDAKKTDIPENNIAGGSLKDWNKILNELKDIGRMILYTNLIGTKAFVIDNKFIGISFSESSSFSKILISKTENSKILEQVIGKHLGREVRIKCVDENSDLSNKKTASDKNTEDFIDKAQGIAKKLNVPINIIE